MLKLKYMFENFELARYALENWGYDKECIDDYLRYFRISSNAVYPFSRNGERHFLRLSPVEEKMEQNLLGELEFLEYLKKKEYPALQPLPAKNGKVLLKLDTEWGSYYASVFTNVAGVCIEDSDYNESIMLAYGKALGRLHTISMEYEPKVKKWTYQDALSWMHEVLTEYQAPSEMLAEAESVENDLNALAKSKENYGLVHYDFEPDNVFYYDEADSCRIIDFEDGMYHFYAVDLEQVRDSLVDELGEENGERAMRKFLEGYRTQKTLTEETLNCLPLMRRFCNLYAYARLIRCVAERMPNEPDWMIEMCKKLNGKIQYLEGIVKSK